MAIPRAPLSATIPSDPFALMARLRRLAQDASDAGARTVESLLAPVSPPPAYEGAEPIVYMATTNRAKAEIVGYHTREYGIRVIGWKLDLVEPQTTSIVEVARAKAYQAFALTGRPVLVHDAAFHVAALNGLPGVYAKDIIDTLGPDMVVGLLKGTTDRAAWFEEALAICLDGQTVLVWSGAAERGSVAFQAAKPSTNIQWGPMSRFFIPQGDTRVLSQRTDEEFRTLNGPGGHRVSIAAAARWLGEEGVPAGAVYAQG